MDDRRADVVEHFTCAQHLVRIHLQRYVGARRGDPGSRCAGPDRADRPQFLEQRAGRQVATVPIAQIRKGWGRSFSRDRARAPVASR